MKRKNKIYILSMILVLVLVLSILIIFDKRTNLYTEQNQVVTEENEESNSIKRLAENVNSDWAVEAIKLKSYSLNKNNSLIKVAVIDSGVNLINENILTGINIIDGNTNIEDKTSHGTSVTELILKVNPNIQIVPIKIVNDSEYANESDVIKALKYALNENVDIINISLGINKNSAELDEILNKCFENNIAIVSSAGNNSGELMYPAANEKVFSVIARDINNIDVIFSNKSLKKSYSAPGVHIKIDDSNYVNGTSFACSFITGVISIIKEYKKDISLEKISDLMQQSSIDSNKYSYGLIQIDKLIELLK